MGTAPVNEAGIQVVCCLPNGLSPSPMGVSKEAPTRLKMTFVGECGAGKTSLIAVMIKGWLGQFQPYSPGPHIMDAEFDPSSYQPECQGVTRVTGHMEEARQAFELQLCDTFTSEDYDVLKFQSYMDSAVIALCFSVANRETFDMIRTKVRYLYST